MKVICSVTSLVEAEWTTDFLKSFKEIYSVRKQICTFTKALILLEVYRFACAHLIVGICYDGKGFLKDLTTEGSLWLLL